MATKKGVPQSATKSPAGTNDETESGEVESGGIEKTRSPLWGRGLSEVVSTLHAAQWSPADYDIRLREALVNTFSILHVVGIVAYIAERDVTIACFLPRYNEEEEEALVEGVKQKVIKVLKPIQNDDPNTSSRQALRFKIDGAWRDKTLAGIVVPIRSEDVDEIIPLQQSDEAPRVDFCAMVYDVNGRWRRHWNSPNHPQTSNETTLAEQVEDKFAQFHGLSTLPMLFQVVLYRENHFTSFPGCVSQRYWEDSAKSIKMEGRRASDRNASDKISLRPPWDIDEQSRTATLSFDLRKSTFCMDQADNPKDFGDWLDELVEILTAVCHLHGGVFDKFTGDGALVHFLQQECTEIYKQTPVEAAVNCAVDMHRAIGKHLERLRKFIRYDCRLLGAGIAIDVSDTYWALDHRGNPITVGRGVVGACRLCDKTDAGRIRMSNVAFQELPQELVSKLPKPSEEDLESKELNKEMQVTVWEFIIPCDPPELELGSKQKIETICNHIYERAAKRRSKKAPRHIR